VIVRRSTDTLVIGDADVAKAMRFIRDHACEHIRVADVLDQVAVSRSTLEARFRTIVGKTIRDEIHDAMLRHAQELIAAKELTLKQVAREAGFSHVQHMTNLFRRRLGRTPGEFQRLARLRGA
jgi:LacI family transcriptional regulator